MRHYNQLILSWTIAVLKKCLSTGVTLFDVVFRHECEKPNATAFVFIEEDKSETRRTFSELSSRVKRIASALQQRLKVGERAVLMYQPSLNFIESMLACFAAGVVAVPVQPAQNRRVISRVFSIIDDCKCHIVLTDCQTLQSIKRLGPLDSGFECGVEWVCTDSIDSDIDNIFNYMNVNGDATAFLQYTSGSTGAPKGVIVTHDNILSNEVAIKNAFGHDGDAVVVGWLPLYHDMGLIGNVFQSLFLGITSILFSPMMFLASPINWLEAISKWGATTSGGPNFAYDLCVRRIAEKDLDGIDLSSWRVAYNGSEPVRERTIRDFTNKFSPYGFRAEAFYPCYGMAECTLFVSGGQASALPKRLHIDKMRFAENVATPLSDSQTVLIGCGNSSNNHSIIIVSPEKREVLPNGQIGEIWVCGPSVARGYWGKPELTEDVFRASTANGNGTWLRTGDLGFINDNELFVAGRIKDLIIIRGHNYYPHDIECAIYSGNDALLPDGCAAFVVEEDDERPKLVVVAEVRRQIVSKFNVELFRSYLAMARRDISDLYGLRLHDLVLIKPMSLPKTSSGKIRRSYCRELYLYNGLSRLDVKAEE